jgi:NTE family protein
MKFNTLSLLLLLFFATPARTEDAIKPDSQPRERIGLVLGGGGARGAAHVGVLKVLEREHVKIDFIAGTSMGAIVGGLYASGYKAAEVEQILSGTDWEDVLNDSADRREQPMERKIDSFGLLDAQLGIDAKGVRLPRGLIQGQKLLMTFRRHLLPVAEINDFDQLSIPFRCVASDLSDGSAVIFKSGDLPFAIRASMSVPAVFQPVRDEQRRLLIDGMVAANVPIEVARNMGATRLIVVDVGEGLSETKDINSPISVTNQVLSILLNRKTQADLKTLTDRDLLIHPELGTTSTSDFPLTPQIIAMGERAAEQAVAQIRAFSSNANDYAEFERTHQLPERRDEQIAFIRVTTGRSRTVGNVEAQLSPLLGQTFKPKKIERAIQAVYGDGRYERISYKTERDSNGRLGLSVLPVDKGWGPNFLRFGVALDDDFQGNSNYRFSAELRLTGRNKFGGEWRTRLDLGKETGIRSEFWQPYGSRSQFYVRPSIDARTRLRRVRLRGLIDNQSDSDSLLGEFRQRSYNAGIETGFDFTVNQRLRADLTRARDYIDLQIGSAPEGLLARSDSLRLGLGYLYDSLNDAAFPSHGLRADAGYRRYFSSFGGSASAQGLRSSIDYARSFGSHTFLAGARLNRPIGGSNGVLQLNDSLGGFANLSGFSQDELFGNANGLARVIYYRRFSSADKLFDSPVYVGASIERGNSWANGGDICACDLVTAGSVFFGADTFFGPMYLGYGRASSGDDALYLSFGSLAFGRGQ